MDLLPNLPVLPNMEGITQANHSTQSAQGASQNPNGFNQLLAQLNPLAARFQGDLRARTQPLSVSSSNPDSQEQNEGGNIVPLETTLLPHALGLRDWLAQQPNVSVQTDTTTNQLPQQENANLNPGKELKPVVNVARTDLPQNINAQVLKANDESINNYGKIPIDNMSLEKPLNPTLATQEGAQFKETMLRHFIDQARAEHSMKDVMSVRQAALSYLNNSAEDIKNNVNSATSRVGGVEQINAMYASLDIPRDSIDARTPMLRVEQNVNNPQWGNELASRILWMSKNQVQHAKIKMNPAHLGPIEVKVSVTNDQASVSFITNQSAVREAIETALPRLRDAFTENGFSSLDVDVSTSSKSHQQNTQQESGNSITVGDESGEPHESTQGDEQDAEQSTTQNVRHNRYQVDMFV